MKQDKKLWIKSPQFDCLFFISLGPVIIFTVLLFTSLKLFSNSTLSVFIFYNLIIRYPHFFSTLYVSYGNQSIRKRINLQKFKFYIVPIIILINYLLPVMLNNSFKESWLIFNTAILYIWGFQHISMQNYGFFRIYRNKEYSTNNRAASVSETIFEKSIFIFTWVSQCIFYFKQYILKIESNLLENILIALTASLVAAYFFYRIKLNNFDKKVSINIIKTPAILHLLLSTIIMTSNFIFKITALEHFAIYNFHHSMAYLGLVWIVYKRKNKKINIKFEAFKFYSLIFLISLFFIILPKLITESWKEAIIQATMAIFVIHYYLEAIIWKPKSGVSFDLIKNI